LEEDWKWWRSIQSSSGLFRADMKARHKLQPHRRARRGFGAKEADILHGGFDFRNSAHGMPRVVFFSVEVEDIRKKGQELLGGLI
jgi:hypothetical protein